MGWKTQDEKLQEAHNQGETDASNGVRTPPFVIAEVVGGATVDEAIDIQRAYDQGQRNHDSQS
ncbi:MAG: hypothetical protein WAV46_01110 [Candidatus Moraniibacteriota bacterium]